MLSKKISKDQYWTQRVELTRYADGLLDESAKILNEAEQAAFNQSMLAHKGGCLAAEAKGIYKVVGVFDKLFGI